MASARRQFAALGRKAPAKLIAVEEGPECPAVLRYLWGYFLEISLGLAVSGMAPSVLTWEGLKAWSDLRQTALAPWESLALMRLSQSRAAILSEKAEEKAKRERTR